MKKLALISISAAMAASAICASANDITVTFDGSPIAFDQLPVIQDGRPLKGNKYQITLEEALAQGRTSCGVCHS